MTFDQIREALMRFNAATTGKESTGTPLPEFTVIPEGAISDTPAPELQGSSLDFATLKANTLRFGNQQRVRNPSISEERERAAGLLREIRHGSGDQSSPGTTLDKDSGDDQNLAIDTSVGIRIQPSATNEDKGPGQKIQIIRQNGELGPSQG
jgi:hypothetical protein